MFYCSFGVCFLDSYRRRLLETARENDEYRIGDYLMEFNDATLDNIAAMLYARLGCTQDASYSYIRDKVLDIMAFDFSDTLDVHCMADVVENRTKSFRSLYTGLSS